MVYLKQETSGNYRIHILDTSTKQSQPFLANEPPLKGDLGISLSLDRRWIVFVADFKRESADYEDGAPRNIVWKVRIDGTQLQRLTPLPNSTLFPKGRRIHYSHPVWSLDGQSIYFLHNQFSGESTSRVGFNTLVRISATGGLPKVVEIGKCGVFLGDITFRPNSGELLFTDSKCSDFGNSSIKLINASFSGNPQEIIPHKIPGTTATVSDEALRWMPDGSGFVFAADATWTDSNQNSVYGRGLLYHNMNNGQNTALIAPHNKDDFFARHSISPDGEFLVYSNYRGEARDLHLFFLGKALRGDFLHPVVLTQDGKSSHPTW